MSYLGSQPNNLKKNTGLYTPSEILQLEKDGSWGGSLELIAEQTVSSVSAVDFTSIKESKYDVHFMQIYLSEATNDVLIQISNNNGTSYHTTGYQFAVQYGSVGGTFAEEKSTNGGNLFGLGGSSTGIAKNTYMYFYNLGNNTKYSFSTQHFFSAHPSLSYYFKFGGGVYPTAETNNAIRLFMSSGNMTGTVKLYGVKQ